MGLQMTTKSDPILNIRLSRSGKLQWSLQCQPMPRQYVSMPDLGTVRCLRCAQSEGPEQIHTPRLTYPTSNVTMSLSLGWFSSWHAKTCTSRHSISVVNSHNSKPPYSRNMHIASTKLLAGSSKFTYHVSGGAAVVRLGHQRVVGLLQQKLRQPHHLVAVLDGLHRAPYLQAGHGGVRLQLNHALVCVQARLVVLVRLGVLPCPENILGGRGAKLRLQFAGKKGVDSRGRHQVLCVWRGSQRWAFIWKKEWTS